MYFDTHAHYTDEQFDLDRGEVLHAVNAEGTSLLVNAASDLASSLAAIALAEAYPFVYATVGWHPHEAKTYTEDADALIRKWCTHPKVKAIGEIGLDFYYDHSEREVQRTVFQRQMELAEELGLPVVIHDREAHGECLEMVKRFSKVKGAFHCYSGSAELAEELLKRGWYLGFTGAITFKNARKALEVIEACPLERMLIETDCPYLAPVPYRGKRSDSRMLPLVVAKIAEVKGLETEEVARLTFENGRRFFSI